MMTVDCRYDSPRFSPDLCVPTVSDIEEEDESNWTDGVTIIAEEVRDIPKERKRSRVFIFLEDLVSQFKMKCQRLRGTLVHAPKQNLEVDLLA